MQFSDLLQAIRENQIKLVDGILHAQPDWANKTDERGSAPLILASYYGHVELTQLILNHGANIDLQDAAGNTALMGVCFKGHNKVAKLLIDKGAQVNLRNKAGGSALTYCATFHNEEVAKWLLSAGAETDVKDNRGLTPADHAKMQGQISFAKMLEKN